MRLKTILNDAYQYKGFKIENCEFAEKKKSINVKISARKNGRPICSCCQNQGPCYDTMKEPRQVESIPVLGYQVFFIYRMRRVDCKHCNSVKIEQVPWIKGKQWICPEYASYLASWAKEMSWKSVANRFHTSWQTVYRSVQFVVAYGLENRRVDNVEAIGVDEVAYHKGHTYMTLVYQIDRGCRRLLWVGKKRTKKTLRRFFTDMWHIDRKFRKNIKVVCSDMWKAYLGVIEEKVPKALNVLDRFHIMQKFGKAIDQVRAAEVKRLKAEGKDPLLKNSRWCFLKRKFNLTKSQKGTLNELLDMNLNTTKAYILKEQFHKFWEYKHPTWAGKFLDSWCEMAQESELEPIIKVANMLQNHRELLLNYFRAKKQFNSGIVEGLNRKINLTVRKAFGFRSFEVMQVALYHQLGHLPEPIYSHKFW